MSINDGLLALYNFHGDARDTSGSGFHGVLTGGPVLTSNQLGESNSAYQFDGTAKWISCVNNPALDVQTLTISAFVSFAVLSQNGFIFEKGTVNTQYSLFSEGTNIVFRTKPSSAYHSTIIAKSAAGITQTDTWYHIVATYDGAYKRIYVNGVKVAEEAWALAISTNTGGQWIGAYGGGAAYRLNGKLSSIRVYGRAISDAEVMSLYKIGTGTTSIMSNGELLSHSFDNVGVDTTGLVAMLGMNGNTKDGSGNGNHGTLSGATPTTDMFGNANSAYSFNPSVGDSINLGNINIGSTDSSIIFMIKSDVTDYGTGGYYHTIYKKENSQMSFYMRSTGLTSMMRVGGALFYHTFSGCFDGNWHSIAVVKNSATGLLHYYKDGVSTGTAAAVGTLDSFADHFYYGRTTTSIFDGSLGRMCLFNRALSDGEIAKLSRIMKGQPSIEKGKIFGYNFSETGFESSGLVGLYSLRNANDTSGNGNHGALSGSNSLGEDSYGNYIDFTGNKDFTAGTGTLSSMYIGNKMNFTNLTDFSWSITHSVLTVPPNNRSGIFGSDFDCAMQVYTNGVVDIGVRAGATINVYSVAGINWITDSGEVHTIGFTYKASESKFYVYVDGVLANTGGTTVTAAFLCNSWQFGDSAILNGNQSSCRKKVYHAAIFSRQLTESEHLLIARTQQKKHFQTKGKTFSNNHISL